MFRVFLWQGLGRWIRRLRRIRLRRVLERLEFELVRMGFELAVKGPRGSCRCHATICNIKLHMIALQHCNMNCTLRGLEDFERYFKRLFERHSMELRGVQGWPLSELLNASKITLWDTLPNARKRGKNGTGRKIFGTKLLNGTSTSQSRSGFCRNLCWKSRENGLNGEVGATWCWDVVCICLYYKPFWYHFDFYFHELSVLRPKHLGTWCLSSLHTQDSTVRVELSGAELGDADLKAGRERAWQTHFPFYNASSFRSSMFFFQISLQEVQVSFHQFPSCVSFGSRLLWPGTLCFCFFLSYLLVYLYFFTIILHNFLTFLSLFLIFLSLLESRVWLLFSEFHASRSWCSTLMITCSDTRMRMAAGRLRVKTWRLDATFCSFFSRISHFSHLFGVEAQATTRWT